MNDTNENKNEKSGLPFPALHPEAVITQSDSDDQSYIVGISYKRYFKVGEIEYSILKLLDGHHSPEDIQKEFLKVKDLEIPLETIRGFIDELKALNIVTFDKALGRKKYFQLKVPDFIYRGLSLLFRPVPLTGLMLLNLAGFIFFFMNIEGIFRVIEPYYSFYFPLIFIGAYWLTSIFHELGHGAAIRNFDFSPEAIRIRRGNGIFFFHFSTPFIAYAKAPITRRVKLSIVGGGLLFDFISVSLGMILFSAFYEGIIGVIGILLILTAVARILVSLNFIYEKTDMAKILEIWFEHTPSFKKSFLYRAVGVLFWLIQYSVFFYMIYIVLYSVRYNVAPAF